MRRRFEEGVCSLWSCDGPPKRQSSCLTCFQVSCVQLFCSDIDCASDCVLFVPGHDLRQKLNLAKVTMSNLVDSLKDLDVESCGEKIWNKTISDVKKEARLVVGVIAFLEGCHEGSFSLLFACCRSRLANYCELKPKLSLENLHLGI